MFLILSLLAGLFTAPPADMNEAVDSLKTILTEATPQQLGEFFSEISLEASPDEIFLWSDDNFCELLMEFSDSAPDSGAPDSLLPLLDGLPLELLTPAP